MPVSFEIGIFSKPFGRIFSSALPILRHNREVAHSPLFEVSAIGLRFHIFIHMAEEPGDRIVAYYPVTFRFLGFDTQHLTRAVASASARLGFSAMYT